jgi:sortase A
MRHKTLDLRKLPKPMYLSTSSQSEPTSPASPKSDDPSLQAIGSQHNKKKRALTVLFVVLAIILLLLSIYILVLMFSPKIQKQTANDIKKVTAEAITHNKNMLLIPSAGIQAEIAEGDVSVLDKGLAWHRFPDRGDPSNGGNTIITGHSFVWGYTPKQIKEKSIFYNLSDVKKGDEVTVVWDKKTYQYTVTDIKDVKPNATEIENKTKDPILTIYTCTSGGSADGRVVVIAKQAN